MARTPFKYIFGNKRKLDLMLHLRKKGWTYHSLALVFGVDYTSIYHSCKKFHVEKEENTVSLSVQSLLDEFGIRAKKVKSYKDYLEESGYKFPEQHKSQVYWEGNSL